MKLYVNISRTERGELEDDLEALVLSIHPDDPCDGVCFGYQHPAGRIPDDERVFFEALCKRWNAGEP